MKKDRVYKIKVEISTNISSVHLAECSRRALWKLVAALFAIMILINRKMMMYPVHQYYTYETNQDNNALILNVPVIYHSRLKILYQALNGVDNMKVTLLLSILNTMVMI